MTIKGIDVSNYQSATYDLTGCDFVFVKATEGVSYVNPKHADQVARARANGRVVGHYHYLRATSSLAAQMDYFLAHAAPRAGELMAVDWEEAGVSCAEKDSAIKYLRSKAGGRKVLLYCSQSYWTGRDTTSYAGDGLWIAQYNGKPGQPSIQAKWVIHQYTSTPLDTNVAAFSSRAEMAAWAAGEDQDMALTKDDVETLAGTDGVFLAPKDAADYSDDESSPDHYWSFGSHVNDNTTRIRRVDKAVAALTAQVAALTATIGTLAQGGALTAAEVQAAAEAGAKAALEQLGAKLQED
ncbi:glycoside hydrolase family 25 protein [Streptomyces cylindrosporus]|uniref:Glycoside hydrolase family 25 protein n=1 Tax=Streptomyces cylindrosporus TaxID=2927583 RepID=A0ABS9YJW0_9ACTN|nr:glycoside hydrolase family 25 protein [Streptomyces cylindrosporus]MCI3277542.1 glycoside hydrolase family 25 protein [Streptomyces cylindrosporus]